MPKALIIDDDKLNLRLLSAMLNHLGYDVFSSLQGNHGVKVAQEIAPDVILLDLLMPKSTYDGVRTMEVLRSLPEFEYTPIIAISAADAQTIQGLLSFTDFMQKPISLAKLKTLLANLNPYTA